MKSVESIAGEVHGGVLMRNPGVFLFLVLDLTFAARTTILVDDQEACGGRGDGVLHAGGRQ